MRYMVTANDVKRLNSLKDKSVRDSMGLFAAEGERAIKEIISAGLSPLEHYSLGDGTINESQIRRISSMKTPQGSFAVFKKPFLSFENPPKDRLSLILDSIQDPGNLGTIIRTCDWFGVDHIYASDKTVDCFNPKVVQSTMGAIARVKVFYTSSLRELLLNSKLPVFGTFMNLSNDIYSMEVPTSGALLVLGNEGNGISREIEEIITDRITIPSFAKEHVESLNVAVAAAIAISEFKRRR